MSLVLFAWMAIGNLSYGKHLAHQRVAYDKHEWIRLTRRLQLRWALAFLTFSALALSSYLLHSLWHYQVVRQNLRHSAIVFDALRLASLLSVQVTLYRYAKVADSE